MNAKSIIKVIQFPIIECRWLLMVFLLGLIAAQGVYCVKYLMTLIDLFKHFWTMDVSECLMAVLELVDMVLIGLLIKMVIVGSYQNSIGKLDTHSADHALITSGSLKIKMASSLVMVSGINLLQPFLNTTGVPLRDIAIKAMIHLIFLTSAIGLAYIEYLHEKCETLEKLPHQSVIKSLDI
jgi:uncharacterized protein (TIGR00645 family)